MANPRSGKKKTTPWDTIWDTLPYRPMEPEDFGSDEVWAAAIRRLPLEIQAPVMAAVTQEFDKLTPSQRLGVQHIARAFTYIRRLSR